jgi:N,N'-diacetyllegionaminate synthase
MSDVNLKAMNHISKKFNVKVGYSDHTLGIEVPIAAVAMGATIIEKHLTLNREMDGPDHFASLEPKEFYEMVLAIKNISLACKGNGIKKPTESELKNVIAARKSIVAKKKILKGEIFNENNLTIKRPGNGISPMSWNKIIGLKSKKNYEIDDLI